MQKYNIQITRSCNYNIKVKYVTEQNKPTHIDVTGGVV